MSAVGADPRSTGRLSLSVVVPARNEEAIIDDCIVALLTQDEPVDQIIVVDNGSTDSTAARVSAYPGVVLISEPQPGISVARTRGFDAADGEIIARIDADTIVDPGWSTAIRQAFEQDPDLAAIGGDIRQSHASRAMERATEGIYRCFRFIHRVMFRAPALLYGHNMALRADVWTRIRPGVALDDRISEDIDIALAVRRLDDTIRFVPQMRAQADLLRTLKPRKLARYLRADSHTWRKYGSRKTDQYVS